jgi:hypothetical protein
MNQVPAHVMLSGKTMGEVNASYKRKRSEAVRKGRAKLVAALDAAYATRKRELSGGAAAAVQKPQKPRKLATKPTKPTDTVALRPVKKPDGTTALKIVVKSSKKPKRPKAVAVRPPRKARTTPRPKAGGVARPKAGGVARPKAKAIPRRKIGIRVRRR